MCKYALYMQKKKRKKKKKKKKKKKNKKRTADSDGNQVLLEQVEIVFVKHYALNFAVSNPALVQYCSKPNYSFLRS